MNIAIIIESKAYFSQFYDLAKTFKNQGLSPIIIFPSRYVEYMVGETIKDIKTYYFSEFKACETVDFSTYPLDIRKMFFSTYERDSYYKIDAPKVSDQDLSQILLFFETVIKENTVECIVNEPVANFFSYAAYFVCEKLKKRYLGISGARIPGKFEIIEDDTGALSKRPGFNRTLSSQEVEAINIRSKAYLNNFSHKKPDYVKNNPLNVNKYLWLKLLRKTKLLLKLYRYNDEGHCVRNEKIKRHIETGIREIKRKNTLHFLNRYYKKKGIESQVLQEPYFIFPLHYQPEASTLVLSPYFTNQYEVIKNCAFMLPPGYKLIVKEHPNGEGFLGKAFYKKLLKLPNVILLPSNTLNDRLIKESKGVITLTSTFGFDALFYLKPVITLGNIFYNSHKFCYFQTGFQGVKEALYKIVSDEIPKELFEAENKILLTAYLTCCLEGTIDFKPHFSEMVKQEIITYIETYI